MIAQEIINEIEKFAPLSIQESYDNSGIQVGSVKTDVQSCIIALDFSEKLIDEAISKDINLIITHHPLIFSGLKSITGKNEQERIIKKAIIHNIVLYSAHTNLDSILNGVSFKLAEKLQLKNLSILDQTAGNLKKLITYCPKNKANEVRNALFESGAGNIGNYERCSFSVSGIGSFKAKEGAKPYVGKIGETHYEDEERIEVVFQSYNEKLIIDSLLLAHPYEEVAYDIFSLNNSNNNIGLGVIGTLENEMTEIDFLTNVAKITGCKAIRHSEFSNKMLKRVAICGGSGSHLIKNAKIKKADVFLSGDVKYHAFAESDSKLLIADIGHFESEQFTKELIFEIITKKFHNFAAYIFKEEENPVNYFIIK